MICNDISRSIICPPFFSRPVRGFDIVLSAGGTLLLTDLRVEEGGLLRQLFHLLIRRNAQHHISARDAKVRLYHESSYLS